MRILTFLILSLILMSASFPPEEKNRHLENKYKIITINTIRADEPETSTKNHLVKEKRKKDKKKYDQDKSANRKAIWGFIFGLASILIFPLFGIPGLILSNDALWEERMHPRILKKNNRTLAYLGKIFSIIGIALLVIFIIYFAFLIAFLTSWG